METQTVQIKIADKTIRIAIYIFFIAFVINLISFALGFRTLIFIAKLAQAGAAIVLIYKVASCIYKTYKIPRIPSIFVGVMSTVYIIVALFFTA